MDSRRLTGHATHEPAYRPRLLEPVERRLHERRDVVPNQAWIGWRHHSIWHEVPASLLNLSAGGLLLVSRGSPLNGDIIWTCLDGTHRTDWVEGVVAAQQSLPSGEREVRVKFVEICPYAFYDLAIYGRGRLRTDFNEPNTDLWI